MFQLLLPLTTSEVLEKLQRILEQQEVNWQLLLTFVSTMIVCLSDAQKTFLGRSRENQHLAYAKTKVQISCAVRKLISAFVFATRIVQFLYFLNPKFPVSSHLLCLYSPVCVGPVWKPHWWFSHHAAHF